MIEFLVTLFVDFVVSFVDLWINKKSKKDNKDSN